MKIKSFSEAQQFLYRYIPRGEKQKFPGSLGLERTKYFLKLLGNPQNKLKIIHVVGTSGKGSTAYLTSTILRSFGFKIGLHVSPHLTDVRERFQINNQFIKRQDFCFYLNQIIPFIHKVEQSKFAAPTYFEILVVLAFYILVKNKVDYVVLEAGMGGLYDATNAVESKNKLVILTKIGLDHTQILGKTIKKIAFQKAMVIKEKNIVVSIWQKPSGREVIEKITKGKQAKLYYVKKDTNFKNIRLTASKTFFDFYGFLNLQLKSLELGLIGSYQVDNCSLALMAVSLLSQRDHFLLDGKKIRMVLKQALFPGRIQIMKIKDKTVVIDGAHNPQKMSSFIKSINKIYPKKKFDFLIAIKKGKDYFNILKHIIPSAHKIIVTGFFLDDQDLPHLSEKEEKIVKTLQKQNFTNCLIIKNPERALKTILKQRDNSIIITGSLYLISQLYPSLTRHLNEKVLFNST